MTFGSCTQKPMDQPHSGDEVAVGLDWCSEKFRFLGEAEEQSKYIWLVFSVALPLGQGSAVTFTVRMTFSMKR